MCQSKTNPKHGQTENIYVAFNFASISMEWFNQKK